MARRAALVAAVTAAALLAFASPAAAAALDRAAEALRDDTVYVDRDAGEVLSATDAADLRALIQREAGGRVYVAFVPPEAVELGPEGDIAAFAGRLGEAVHRDGAYVVVAGEDAVALGDAPFERGQADALLDEAIADAGGEVLDGITLFVPRAGAVIFGEPPPAGAVDQDGDRGGAGRGWLVVLAVGAAGLLGWTVVRRRRAAAVERARFAEVREAVTDDHLALGEDVRALDAEVSMADADPRAAEHYHAALDQYERAGAILDRARTADDLEPATRALEEGRYDMAAARALLRGEPVPERRGPCFFDPRHGPSVREVEWAPPGGAARDVPACAACAIDVEEGREPASRGVRVGNAQVPHWAAPSYFAPMTYGYFGAGAVGLVGGLLLADAMAPDVAWGSGTNGDFADAETAAGDFAGGDFGGGDFGGGDFGGG
jgi:hypothetical protein